jgi:ABC-type transport system substrate-binding protein
VLIANEHYSGGKPNLTQIELRPYSSIRAAWADLLRGNVDMLYEVGVDALSSLEPSSRVRVMSYRRHYQLLVLFNVKRPPLRDAAFRRQLNRSIDRRLLIGDSQGGRGTPSQGPIWPDHWAAPQDAGFAYSPTQLADPSHPIRLTCVIADPTHERVAIALQRQLQSVGVYLDLRIEGAETSLKRVSDGDFDLVLLEAISAPNLLRPYLFWHSKGPYNYGGFSSIAVDTALDTVRHALSDDVYVAGVAAFQRAIVDDPPALFLAWSERARAVSTAFDVQAEAGRDPLVTLRMWRPSVPATGTAGN